MSESLRAAVAGTGFIGPVHARAARLAGARLVGVAASTPERSAAAAAALGAERADTAEALAIAPDVDVLHVCTPNALHVPLVRAALAAGKHVVCEKPLAGTGEEAQALLAAAEDAGRVATVPFAYRYNPVVFEARARVAAGALGALRLVHGGYLQDWLAQPGDSSWRVGEGPSRAFADIGSHWCDLFEFVCGERIGRVLARFATVVEGRGDEDAATVLLETADGVIGTMLVSQVSPGRKNHLHLECAFAHASVRFEEQWPETLWVGRRTGTETVWRDPETLHPAAARVATVPAGHPQGYADGFATFVADTYAAIRTGVLPDGTPTFADGVRAARVVDAVVASAAAGGVWIDVR
ncbi:MAG: Gfo/Idh/MocA family protein [Solirubrobacteraceae bacterium]